MTTKKKVDKPPTVTEVTITNLALDEKQSKDVRRFVRTYKKLTKGIKLNLKVGDLLHLKGIRVIPDFTYLGSSKKVNYVLDGITISIEKTEIIILNNKLKKFEKQYPDFLDIQLPFKELKKLVLKESKVKEYRKTISSFARKVRRYSKDNLGYADSIEQLFFARLEFPYREV